MKGPPRYHRVILHSKRERMREGGKGEKGRLEGERRRRKAEEERKKRNGPGTSCRGR